MDPEAVPDADVDAEEETTPRVPRRRRLLAPFEPVRVRITLATTLAFGLAFAGASVALVHTVRNTLEAHQHAEATAAARNIASQLESGTEPDRLTTGLSEPVYFRIVSGDGTVIAGSSDATLPVLRFGREHSTRMVSADGTVYDLTWRRVTVLSQNLSIAIATPLTEVRRSVDTLARSLWVGTPGLIVLVGLIAWLLVGRALRPVEAIRAQADEITATTMHRRVPVPNTDDEVARLARR